MKMNYRQYLIIGFLILILYSCCDCPLDPSQNPIICKVREVTITEFNPGINKINDTTFIPVPEYSIHTFKFPSSDASSGSLPNDERFASKDIITIASITAKDGYRAVIFDRYPINNDLNSDIMVISANPVAQNAVLRFGGYLAKLNLKFMSENAREFCEFIEANRAQIEDSLRKLKLYGIDVQGYSTRTYTVGDIEIIDAAGQIVTSQTGKDIISQEQIDNLLKTVNMNVNVFVEIGDVFVYESIDKQRFIFTIADVRRGTFDPQKRRVSIMFNRI
jgi:hypothetical protein